MTKIDDNLISKLEKLSRLRLSSDEKETIKNDLGNIVNMFDRLQEVDTTDVAPMRHITDAVNRLREDRVANQLTREEALANAPVHKDGFIAVPKFLKPKS
ncbi:MAG: Asp-tRNA(Asn)/Glu-tRNA(Gln) amidotransferase subunit GatC [Bacteroidota bacterium]